MAAAELEEDANESYLDLNVIQTLLNSFDVVEKERNLFCYERSVAVLRKGRDDLSFARVSKKISHSLFKVPSCSNMYQNFLSKQNFRLLHRLVCSRHSPSYFRLICDFSDDFVITELFCLFCRGVCTNGLI